MLTYLDYNGEVVLPSNVFEVLTTNIFKSFYVIQDMDDRERWFNLSIGESKLRVTIDDDLVYAYRVIDYSSESTIRRFCTKNGIYTYTKIDNNAIYTYEYNPISKKYAKIATCVRKYNTNTYLITEAFVNEALGIKNSKITKLEEYRIYNYGKPNEWKLIL